MTATDVYSCGRMNVCSCLQVFNVFTHQRHEIVWLAVQEEGREAEGGGRGAAKARHAGYQESARRKRQANNFYFYRHLPGVVAPPSLACGGWHYWLLKGRCWCCVAVRGSRVPGWARNAPLPAARQAPAVPEDEWRISGRYNAVPLSTRTAFVEAGGPGEEGRLLWWQGCVCGGAGGLSAAPPAPASPSQPEIKAARTPLLTQPPSLTPGRCDINSSRVRVSYKPLDCNDIISSFHG